MGRSRPLSAQWQAALAEAAERERFYCSKCDLTVTGVLAAEDHLVFTHNAVRLIARELVTRLSQEAEA